ncbi:hypothetical protein LG299_12595 [Microbacterium lacus]|uniref:hypothetical protein n=1 Tax=Microbacterium lacus TaxID=415217 RepID=UPI00384B1AA6
MRRPLGVIVALAACAVLLGHAQAASTEAAQTGASVSVDPAPIVLAPTPVQVARLILASHGVVPDAPIVIELSQAGMHASCPHSDHIDGDILGCVEGDTIVLYAPFLADPRSGQTQALIAHESAHLALRQAGKPYPAPELAGLAGSTAHPGINAEEAAVSCLGPHPSAYRDIECTPTERVVVAVALADLTGVTEWSWWSAGLGAFYEPMVLTAPQQALVSSWRSAAGVVE